MKPDHEITTIHALFLRCAEQVESGQYMFICWAINGADAAPPLKLRAKDMVMGRLEGAGSYMRWVSRNHPELYAQACETHTAATCARQGRVAWCKALAEEFKDQ